MATLYRWFLHLYPADHRLTFGAEMITVFRQARSGVQRRGPAARITFYLREFAGLVRGALHERARALVASPLWAVIEERSFVMRSQFRFSATAIFFMVLTFVASVIAILTGENVIIHEARLPAGMVLDLPRLPRGIAMFFLVSCVVGGIGWLVTLLIHRTGVDRLSKLQNVPPQR